MSHINSYFTIVGEKTGRFLSNFKYVILTLFSYLIICLFTYCLLAWSFSPNYNQAALITYSVITGGDPFIFENKLENHFLLWNWLLILHVIAWLIVPVLAGTAISASFLAWEDRKTHLEMELLEAMKKVISESPKGKDLSLSEIREKAIEEKSAMVKAIRTNFKLFGKKEK